MERNCPSLISAFDRVAERERFGQIFFGEDFGFQAVRNLVVFLLQHDAAGNAGERLADGCHIGMRFAVPFAEIFFVNQVSVPHHQQAAVLAGFLLEFESLIQTGKVHARYFANLRRAAERAPAARTVRRREVVVASAECHWQAQQHQAEHTFIHAIH